MCRKFLKVCDGVSLIVSPCQYKGFNLNPGMILFDADTSDRPITSCDVPFVATHEASGVNSSDYGRPTNIPILCGFLLNGDSVEPSYADINADSKTQIKLLNTIDLALGESRLHNLLFTMDSDRYTKNTSFSVYDPNTNTGFNSIYTNMVGNVFLQHVGDSRRDKAVLLTNTQVDAFNKLSPYGIIEYGKSDLRLEYNRGEYDEATFHDLLYVLGNNRDSMNLTKAEFDDICSNLQSYYTTTSVGFECVDVDDTGILTMCDDFVTTDGFHVKPFMIKMSPDLAKKYLCYADNGEYVDTYEYYDFDGGIDDNLHSVYLTSIAGYDTNNYDTLYSGSFFDGYSFVKTRFSLTDAASECKFDLDKYIYSSIDEANYAEDELSNCKDIDELRVKVKNRQDELSRLVITDSSFSKEEADILNFVYGAYLSTQEHKFESSIDYESEQLTDQELYGTEVDSFDIPEVTKDDKSSNLECD